MWSSPFFIFSRRVSVRLISGTIHWWSHLNSEFSLVEFWIIDLISSISKEPFWFSSSCFLWFFFFLVWESCVFLEISPFHKYFLICFHEVFLNILFYHLNLCRIFRMPYYLFSIFIYAFSLPRLVSSSPNHWTTRELPHHDFDFQFPDG